MTADVLRVLVVDDHRTFAELLAGALTASGMEVVGTAHTAAQAEAMVVQLRPDIVVMDIEMPGQDGLAATRRIREVAPGTVVAVLTAHRDPEWVVRAAQAGACAFIPKDGSLADMMDALGRVRAGQMLVAPSIFANPVTSSHPARGAVPRPTLTRRERDVLDCLGKGMQLDCLGKGMQVKEIARVLGITLE